MGQSFRLQLETLQNCVCSSYETIRDVPCQLQTATVVCCSISVGTVGTLQNT